MCWQLEGLSSGCETACGKWTLQICLARFWESNQKIFFFSWKILFWIFHALIWNVFSHYFDILTERRILFLLLIYDRITHSMLFFKKRKEYTTVLIEIPLFFCVWEHLCCNIILQHCDPTSHFTRCSLLQLYQIWMLKLYVCGGGLPRRQNIWSIYAELLFYSALMVVSMYN